MANLVIHCRVMYPHIAQPKQFDSDKDPMYRASLVVPAGGPEAAKILAAYEQHIASDLEGVIPTGNNILLKQDPNNPNLAGYFYVSAKSKFQPELMQNTPQGHQPLLDASIIQDGDWIWASINTFAYTRPNAGVSAFLNHVMYDRRGEGKIGSGGGPSADEAFKDVPVSQATPGQAGGVPQINPNPYG